MPATRELYDLQAVDLELDRRNRRLEEIAGQLGDEGPLPALRSAAEQLTASVGTMTAP